VLHFGVQILCKIGLGHFNQGFGVIKIELVTLEIKKANLFTSLIQSMSNFYTVG